MMRKVLIALTLIFFSTAGCVFEPPTILYSFEIVNKSPVVLVVESRTIRYDEFSCDTLKPNQEFKKDIFRLGCFMSNRDTLIRTFFKELKIRSDNKDLTVDCYKRANWVERQVLKGSGHCTGGTVFYTLVINDVNLK
jgi:hypothetical protein